MRNKWPFLRARFSLCEVMAEAGAFQGGPEKKLMQCPFCELLHPFTRSEFLEHVNHCPVELKQEQKKTSPQADLHHSVDIGESELLKNIKEEPLEDDHQSFRIEQVISVNASSMPIHNAKPGEQQGAKVLQDSSVEGQQPQENNKNQPRACNVCGKVVLTLTRHMRTHTGERPYSCKVCAVAFTQACNLYRHLRSKHGIQNPQSFHEQAKKAAASTPEPSAPQKHRNRGHFCSLCKAHLPKDMDFVAHIKNFHKKQLEDELQPEKKKPLVEEIESFECPVCRKAFKWKKNMKVHMRIMHEQERPHACPHCRRTFWRAGYLSTHLNKEHEMEMNRMLKCSKCPESFLFKSELTRHIFAQHKAK